MIQTTYQKSSSIQYYTKSFIDIFLFIVGFLIVYPLGFRSLMALDQGIIFEAGARITNGQKPFADFYLPFGLTPSYLQALLFSIFGVKWKIYVLHACIINGFTTVIVYKLITLLTSYPSYLRIFVSLYTAFVFYTLPATPYAENHSQFFCLLGLHFFMLSIYKKPIYILCAPLCLFLAFFSKQNPAIFYLILLAVLFLSNFTFIRKNLLLFLLAWLPVILISIYFIVKWGHWDALFYYQWTLPTELGSERVGVFNFKLFRLFFRFAKDGAKYFIYLLPIIIYLAYKQKANLKRWNQMAFGLGVFFITIISASITQNQSQIAYSFLSLGIFILIAPLYFFLQNKKPIYSILFGMIITITSLAYCIPKTNFIIYRGFNDIKYSYKNEQITYNKQLDIYLQELCPMASNAEYDSVLTFLDKSGKNFIWFGDASFMGSIIGNSSPMPLVFYHPELSYPDSKLRPEKFKELQRHTFRKMEEKNTRYLMIENEKTFMGATLHEFWDPLLPYGTVVKRFGNSKIYEIDDAFYYEVAFRKH